MNSDQFAPVADLQWEISAIASRCTEDDGEPQKRVKIIKIMATLVGQGLSLMPLIRWLGLTPGGESEQERQQARLAAAQAALIRLQNLAGQEWVPEGTWTHLRS